MGGYTIEYCKQMLWLLFPLLILLTRVEGERVRGAIVVLSQWSAKDVALLARSIQSVDRAFNSRLGYPIIIFSGVSYGESRDRLPREDQRSSLINITHSRLVFAEVNFSSYYFSAPHAATSPDNVEGFKRGYRDMCRFFGGLIADHEALQSFDYYMRMDSDSEFDLHVPYDPIQSMRRFGWRYGYAATSCDYHPVTTGLFDVVAAHYRSTLGKELLLPAAFSETTPCHNINEHRWRWRASQALRWIKRAGQRQFAHASYNDRIWYNNFEVVDLAWMRSPEYRAAFKAVDDAGGIYDHRWGDAPIRTLLVLALLPLDEVHHFRINGYRHQGLLVTPGYVDILPPRRVNPGYPEAEWSADIGSAAITADQSRETILLLASLGALLLWFALRRHCGGWLCGAAQAGIGGASRVPAATAKEDVTVSGRRMVLHA